jgi:hypothetical protein
MGLAKAIKQGYQRANRWGFLQAVRGAGGDGRYAGSLLTAADRGSAKVPEWRRSKLLKRLAM